ncbi:hypothetical protein BU24DRAFT_152223 [Aaosphaeria arxii CBS 175.79]|uniref:Nuclear pore complex NUP2/50/61 domain-containing protein n=1 Tax=Aaosphaeria arxii CBS 175.79 TaxID=1450172 RepID=A0A6A5XY20_9PLEO|nr:uncharacterized protein BU24DRAFT_152223 [Aaosphaeria arxii CBS 175.79]KAF2017540.1 hypothetical protein BU24DRAFT_152223 [Aaosphaeria arxii CBS 175.79]
MSKRLGPFAQGKPENPYEDRDAPGETPQRATAAQMAARKIKSAKPMRRGANSGLSQPSSSFGGPSGQPSFGFGASAPAPGGNGASNPFASINQQPAQSAGPFGGSASTSFPPAQSSAPSNAFSSSSFPAFGGNNSNGGSGFNPQPPSSTDFNFSASSSNPFGNPTANGGSSTAFSGSIFNFGGAQSQNANNTAAPNNTPFTSTAPQSNPFGGFNTGSNTNTSNSMFGQSTAASSNPFGGLGASNKPNDTSSTSNMFGASAPATTSSSSMFGNISATSNSASPAISSAPNPFAGLNSTAQNGTTTTSAPAGGNLFGTTAPSSNSIFSSGSNPFAKIPTPDTATTAAPSNLFNNTTTSTQPPNNPFAGVLSGTPSAAPSPSLFSATPAAPSNPFGGLSTSTSTEQSSSLFKPAQSTPKPEAPSTTPAAFNFGASLAKEPSKPAETPKPSGSSLFSGFGSSATPAKAQASNDKADTPKQPFSFMSTPKPADSGVSAPESASAPKANPFSGIATSTTLEKEKSLAQSTPSFGMFAKQTPAASPALPAFQPQAASSFTPFSQSPMPEKTQPPATTPAPAAAPPTATETTQESVKAKTANLPDVPKAHVPQQWKQFSAAPSSSNASGDDVNKKLVDLSAELGTLNERYRQKIISLPPMADWTALSKWHFQQSSEIAKKVIAIKKQRAAAMGITGNESVLSTKRKGSDDAPTESAYGTPSKKARPAGPSTSSVNGDVWPVW